MIELTKSDYGDYYTDWRCDVPPDGVPFRVLDSEWDESTEPPTRIVYIVELVESHP